MFAAPHSFAGLEHTEMMPGIKNFEPALAHPVAKAFQKMGRPGFG
jgi:hypothetical protein